MPGMDLRQNRTAGALQRVLAALLAAGAASVLLVFAGMPAASAHDQLLAATPADGTSVADAPASVQLRFSRPLPELGAQVVVHGPDGAVASEGAVQVERTLVTQPLAPDLPAGTYTVDWRVTSSDGHPISGTATFTVTEGAAAPTPAPVSEAAAAQPADSSSSSSGLWIGVGAGVVLLVAIAVAARQLRRRA